MVAQKWWLVAAVRTDIPWPDGDTEIDYMGHKLLLRPSSGDNCADITYQYGDPSTVEDALRIVSQYLSALAWAERRAAAVKWHFACTTPMRCGRGPYGPPANPSCYLRPVPVPSDGDARLALALYREAISVDSIPYQFLGFYKIVSIKYGDGSSKQKAWIRNAMDGLVDQDAVRRRDELTDSGADIWRELYASGRCAIAHAAHKPIVNPDNPTDLHRLASDMPLMQALAEHLMETELGLPRPT